MGKEIGYIIMPRELVNDKWILKHHFDWWFILVSMATHKEHPTKVKNQIVRLKRGELCGSIRYLADKFYTSDTGEVSRWLRDLQEREYIKRRRLNYRVTVIEIIGYDYYCKPTTI